MAEEQKRYRFVSDDDGHDYLIEVGKEDAFDKWLDAVSSGDPEFEGEEFDDDAIGCNPSCYSFADPRSDR